MSLNFVLSYSLIVSIGTSLFWILTSLVLFSYSYMLWLSMFDIFIYLNSEFLLLNSWNLILLFSILLTLIWYSNLNFILLSLHILLSLQILILIF